VLGLLGLPFGIFAPFAVWSGVRSLRRIRAADGELGGETAAVVGVAAGLLGLAALVAGTAYWFLAS
jgi:hypothetical protein